MENLIVTILKCFQAVLVQLPADVKLQQKAFT